MDNCEYIKNLTSRLKSRILCDEIQCPAVRERLTHHMRSHHRRSSATQSFRRNSSSSRTFENPINNTDGQTSTSDIDRGRKFRRSSYKTALEIEVRDWAEDLPRYFNPSAESMKLNVIEELIEKIDELKNEVNEEYYGAKLFKQISKCVDSLPPCPMLMTNDASWNELKDNLVNRVNELNSKSINKKSSSASDSDRATRSKHRKKPKIKNNGTSMKDNTRETKKSRRKNSGTSTSSRCFSERCMANASHERKYRIKRNIVVENDAEVQVQQDFLNVTPYYNKIYTQSHSRINGQQIREKEFPDIDELAVKEKLAIWMERVIAKSGRNIGRNDKKVMTDVLFNRLNPLLNKQMSTQKYETHLKEIIVYFLNDYFKDALDKKGVYYRKLIESLTVTLVLEKLNVPHSTRNSECSYYCTTSETLNSGKNCYFKLIFTSIVKDALESFGILSESLENNITIILLQHIDHIRNSYHHQGLKEDLCTLLKSSTNLSYYAIDNIINVIIDQLSYIIYDNCDSIYKDNRPTWSHNIQSFYKSEIELRKPKYSDLIKKDVSQLDARQRVYTELIYALVTAWVKSLPKEHRGEEEKHIEETIIKSLAIDILDHVKQQARAPEASSEKEKLFSFLIYRWLNRFEYFHAMNNVKPYVDKLINKLIDIPVLMHESQIVQSENEFTVMTTYSQAIHINNNATEEISQIIKRQPSDIFITSDKDIRDHQVHEFSLQVQNSLVENISTDSLMNDIVLWLKTIVKPEEQYYFNILKEQLSSSINRSRTTEYKNIGSMTDIIKKEEIKELEMRNEILIPLPSYETIINNAYDPESQLKEIVTVYIGHLNDVENALTRKIFEHIFKTEVLKLISYATKQSYGHFHDNGQYLILKSESLARELKYMNIISDWLRELPITTAFNRVGNTTRFQLLNNLAKNLNDVKENTSGKLTGIEYEELLASIINKYVDQFTIFAYGKRIISAMVDNLILKLEDDTPSFCSEHSDLINIVSSKNSTRTPDEQLSYFIAKYVHDNSEELSNDDLKLEALSARLFKEIMKLGDKRLQNRRSDIVEADQVVREDMPVRRLSFKLCYAKDISDYLSTLPLVSITDNASKEVRVKMTSELAERMYERWQDKNDDPNNIYADTDLSDYITLWITELPLDTSKEIDELIVLEQLLKRMERVNKNKLEKQTIHNNTSKMCYVNICRTLKSVKERRRNPGAAIVEEIERWCTKLPLEIENENVRSAVKENVAKELYKKISELNVDPKCFTDNNLYQELLSDEIDAQLSNLPQNPKLQSMTKKLKKQLLSSIMEKRIQMREQASSIEYKIELEKVIGLSLPNPLQEYQEESPGFKIYKDRLATMFILENFDHGYDDFKENYKKSIKKEIDKYSQEAQKRNAIPLSKDKIYNDLYSTLFNVPLPNKKSISEEVEEIKTRCEIDNWFQTLPIRESVCTEEILNRNLISAMLAKRIHKMEKYDRNSDNSIQKEIKKWLSKFPFMPGQENNVDELARRLLVRLKSTSKQRQCTQRKEGGYIKELIIHKNKSKSKEDLDTNLIASASKKSEIGLSPGYFKISSFSPTNLADLIFNIVESWCQQLNLPANTPQERDNVKAITDNFVTKILMKISELNVNYESLNNDFLYDALLDDELENLLSSLPTSYEFNKSKQSRKNQLKEEIKSVKPVIRKEKAKYEYKQELQNVVGKFLKEPKNKTLKVRALYNSLKDNIVDNFIIYNYNKNNEGGDLHKIMINVAVDKYLTDISEDTDVQHDPMMIGNHLMCEMAKIPAPSENAILDEIKEIQIKFEITDFFNEEFLCTNKNKLPARNQVIASLAKRINGLTEQGFTPNKYYEINNEILKCLKKLDEDIMPEKVDTLIENIINIPEKRAFRNSGTRYVNLPNTDGQICDQIKQTSKEQNNFGHYRNNQNSDDEQGMSLLSETPNSSHNVDKEATMTMLHDIHRPSISKQGKSFKDDSKIEYSNFTKGVAFTSFFRDYQEPNDINLAENQRSDISNEPKQILSNQDSKLMQNISLQQSSSENRHNMTVKHHQNKQTKDQQPVGQRQENQERNEVPSLTQANRSKEYPRFIQNQTLQSKYLQQPLQEEAMHRQVPQNISTTRIPSSENQDSTKKDTRPLSIQLRNEERKNSSNQSNLTRKSSMQLENVLEPNQSQSLSSNVQLTESENKHFGSAHSGKRRPSILFSNPNQISDSNNDQCPKSNGRQESLRKESQTSDKQIGSGCQCGCKSNSVCKSDIPLCHLHKKKRCRTYSNLNQLYSKMPSCRYPGFYFY